MEIFENTCFRILYNIFWSCLPTTPLPNSLQIRLHSLPLAAFCSLKQPINSHVHCSDVLRHGLTHWTVSDLPRPSHILKENRFRLGVGAHESLILHAKEECYILIYRVFMRVCACACVSPPLCVCSCFSLSTTWVLGIELRSLGLPVNSFI